LPSYNPSPVPSCMGLVELDVGRLRRLELESSSQK
jgi:hypothetical protein